ncbi:MAG: hypothetical protein KIT89_12725 [Microcella sp.]|uniref:hypothetical protein n=1 Tax=Microcella sp. TaxID=1913979 RepID=UPI0024C5410C|nr:hypothetical protein [Microcella sp.]UYN83525.1 MAG: hypothetical protein KIT89_12725 [Microcella sp.]
MEIVGGFVSALVAGGVTVLVVIGAVFVVGFVIVSRRRTRPAQVSGEVRRRAGSALVRADDRIAEGEGDVEFAIAQFGETAAADYLDAVQQARSDRAEIFRLHRLIDDEPGAGLANRERAARIVMLADRIDRELGEHATAFRDRRSLESTAGDRLDRLRRGIADARERLVAVTRQRDALLEHNSPATLGPAADAPERAARELERADSLAADAAPGLTAPAPRVMTTIADAERLLFSAEQTLGLVGATAARLDDAVAALTRLRDDSRTVRSEALEAAAAAPDGDSGAAITAAVAQLDRTMSGPAQGSAPTDPFEQLDDLRRALDAVEVALASSRTQAQRLAHAREAFQAARVQTEAQVAAARAALTSGGSAGARARLNEAEIELRASLALIDTEPVDALDAVRRALTHARDAEVLARY